VSSRRDSAAPGFILLPVVLALSLIAVIAFLLNREAATELEMTSASARGGIAQFVAEAGFRHQLWRLNQAGCTGYTDLPATLFGAHIYGASVSATQGSPVTITATGNLADGTARTYSHVNVPVYTAVTTTVLQPGAAGEDLWLDASNPTWNFGVDSAMRANNNNRNILIRFDLSAISSGSKVTSATLDLYLENLGGTGDTVMNIHRVTQSWQEGTGSGSATGDGATWNSYDGSGLWSAPGGDYDPSVAASATVSTSSGIYSWDVTALVNIWAGGIVANEGLLLRGTESRIARFSSGDHANATRHPSLTVTSACQCGNCQFTTTLSAVGDTWIRGNQTKGTLNRVRAGVNNGGNSYYPLLRFDVLSTIPPGATILSAVLRLYEYQQTGAQSYSVNAHKITQDWVEAQANRDNASTGTPWTGGPGGTYDPTVIDSTTVNTGDAWREWDVTPLVQEWVDGAAGDYGVQLVNGPVANGTNTKLRSREATSNQLELVVTYSP